MVNRERARARRNADESFRTTRERRDRRARVLGSAQQRFGQPVAGCSTMLLGTMILGTMILGTMPLGTMPRGRSPWWCMRTSNPSFVLAAILCVASGCRAASLTAPGATTANAQTVSTSTPSRERANDGPGLSVEHSSTAEPPSDAPYHWMAPVTRGACRPISSWGLSGRRAPGPYRHASDALDDARPGDAGTALPATSRPDR